MKISTFYKSRGHYVEWWDALTRYDAVYSSKVFTFTPEDDYLPADVVKGGTGYGLFEDLPDYIDDEAPDYSIYPNVDYAVGFLTRGCVNKCPWCVVPTKEGAIRAYREWTDIKRPDSRDIVFMDNNVLASEHGLRQMEKIIGADVRIDFNQGLDARLVTPEIAEIISRLKWRTLIRFACDRSAQLPDIERVVELLGRNGIPPSKIFVYMLITDVNDALSRARALKKLGVKPFGQPYRDFATNTPPSEAQKNLARWINRKWVFYSCDFEDYKKGGKNV